MPLLFYNTADICVYLAVHSYLSPFSSFGYTVERRLSERQSSETSNIRTHIFFFKMFSASLFKKKTVYSERVAKPAEIARQTAKSLLKEVEILQAAWWYNT